MFKDNTSNLSLALKAGQYKSAFITTHHKPDGDAMGSTLGLYHFLKNYIPEVQVITPTDYATFLNWIPGNDQVVVFEEQPQTATSVLNNADLIFCLDFNTLSRVNELGELIRNSKADKVMIDHHLEPEGFEKFTLWSPKFSSTCELVLHFIVTHFSESEITPEIANCLYTGLMTDTNNFCNNNVVGQTFRHAALLLERGAKNTEIYDKIYNVFTENRSRLFGYSLYEKLELLPEIKTAIISLTKEELERFNVQTGDTEGLVNFPLGIAGIVLSVLIIDRTKLVKMSFRSKGDFAVNTFAAEYFGGGGHKNASGGQSTQTLEETVARFKEKIMLYKTELQNA